MTRFDGPERPRRRPAAPPPEISTKGGGEDAEHGAELLKK
jgi:hypothetical protein